MRIVRLLVVGLALTACATPSAKKPAELKFPSPPEPTRTWSQERPVVIRHVTLMPASGPALRDGAIAFADGLITAVGPNAQVPTPEGAQEVDGTGLYVTPGIIDAHSHLGVYATPSVFPTQEGNEMTAPVTAEVSAEHAFWPQDPGLRRAAAGGITSLLVLPGSANLIGGRGFPVKLHFGRSAAEMRFPGAKDSLKMACGENPRRVYGRDRKVAPQTRMGNVAGYRAAFLQAKHYIAQLEEYERKLAEDPKKAGPPPLRDLKLETLAQVLRGELLVQNHCYRADEMAVMLRLAEELGFKIHAFHHALEAYKIRDLLAQKGVASATWADWWGFKMEAWDGIPYNAGLLAEAGAPTVVHSDSAYDIQRLNQETAKAMWSARRAGIPISEEQALRWVTLSAAALMGVDAMTGSLEPGKMADVVLWSGHPFSVYTRALKVWADGVLTYDAKTGAADRADFELGIAEAVGTPAGAPPTFDAPSDWSALPLEQGACVALRNVTAVVDGAPRPQMAVLIDQGRIAQVRPADQLQIPSGCRQVDAKGRVLTAGLVDPISHLGLSEIPAEESTVDVGPVGEGAKDPFRAAARAADALNPASQRFPVVRGAGVLLAGAVPSGGLVAGQSALVDATGAIRADRLAMHVNLGQTGRSAVSGSRAQVIERLRELLQDARLYRERRADYERNALRTLAASRLDLEALLPVLEGKLPVVFSADRESDIRAALNVSREFNLRPIIAGGAEAWRVSDALAQQKVPVILTPTRNLPESFDALHTREDAAAVLHKAGVKVAFSTLADDARTPALGQLAGNAVASGMPWAAAYEAITSTALEALGQPGGRIAEGAPADLVLWNGDPFELAARPTAVWIAGQQRALDSRHTELLRKYRKMPTAGAKLE